MRAARIDASSVFVVVAVVSDREQEEFREVLMDIERAAGTVEHKWHKSHSPKRLRYLELAVGRDAGRGEVFFGCYRKPLPYFVPMIEVVERAIKAKAAPFYTARVIVDGIDRQKGAQLTNALRLRAVSLEMVRSQRDESEPVIRLADMWAGCIRAANLGKRAEKDILQRAIEAGYITRLNEKTP